MDFYEMCERNLLTGVINYLYYKEKYTFNDVIEMLENVEDLKTKIDELQLDSAGRMAYLTFNIVPEQEKKPIIEKIKIKVKKYMEINGVDFLDKIKKEEIESNQNKINTLVEKIVEV